MARQELEDNFGSFPSADRDFLVAVGKPLDQKSLITKARECVSEAVRNPEVSTIVLVCALGVASVGFILANQEMLIGGVSFSALWHQSIR